MEYNNTEIFLYIDEEWRPLEVSDTIPFPITYNIADIRDITKRNTTFSKTIEIPGTHNNNELLNYIFDVANYSTFNPNKKVKCTVVVDTVPVIQEAVFQLTNIKTDDNNHWVYECVIFGDTDSIIKEIGDKMMTDIDISELGHNYSEINIVNSWTEDWSNGYYYGLADFGYGWDITAIGPTSSTGTKVTQMKPALYAKYLWNKMFQETGWSYQSNFLSATSSPFNDMVILGGNELSLSTTYSYYNSFRSSPDNNISVSLGHTYSKTGFGFGSPLQFGYTGSNLTIINGWSTTQSPMSVDNNLNDNENYSSFTSSRFIANDDITSPNGDPSNLWDTISNVYIHPSTGGYVSICGNFDITISSTSSLTASVIGDNSVLTFDVMVYRSSLYNVSGGYKRYMPINGNNGYSSTNGWPIGVIYSYTHSFVNNSTDFNLYGSTWNRMYGGQRYTKQFSTPLFNSPGVLSPSNPFTPLQPGEKVWFKLVVRPYNLSGSSNIKVFPSFNYIINSSSYVYNYVDSTLAENMPINTSSMLPKNFKQIDFFTSIVKMFNLYIEPDKNISKRLVIEPRDDYYASGREKDWTDKVDISQEIQQQIVAEAQNKALILTYKQDKDAYNSDYQAKTKEVYGQYRYEIDNDFIKGEQKIEVAFASTPVTYLQGPNGLSNDAMLLPVIAKNDNGTLKTTDFIPRILFKHSTGKVNFSDPSNYWKFNGTLYPYYPYIGHFNDPRSATDDLNFGQTLFLYYNLNNITSNNLFTNYYRKQLDELTDKDSRIVTLNMKLTPQDINDFSFRDRIILNGISSGTINYFRVNKIEYDPTSKGTFKVELLKARDIPRRTTRPRFISRPISKPMAAVQGIAFGNLNDNITYANDIGIVGRGNTVLGGNRSVIINGDDNYVGENNKNLMVMGDGNYVPSGSRNVLIVGDGITLQPGQSGIFFDKQPQVDIKYIDAGTDMVLNPYSEISIINYIDAGKDVVRPLGSQTTTNLIDGKVDQI